MTRIKAVGPWLAAAAVLGATLSLSANAFAIPEEGRCVSVPPGAGQYTVPTCTGGAKAGGSFEWEPGALKNKFVAVGGETIFETVTAEQIKCKSILEQGEYGIPVEELVSLRMLGCEIVAFGGKCQNAGPEEIVTITFEGDYGFIKAGVKPTAGVDLTIGEGTTPENRIEFNCDTPSHGLIHVVMFGEVIAHMTPLDKMTKTFKKKYSQKGGKQNPTHFEGGPPESLTLIIGASPPVRAGMLTAKAMVQSNEEPLEIRALP